MAETPPPSAPTPREPELFERVVTKILHPLGREFKMGAGEKRYPVGSECSQVESGHKMRIVVSS